MDACQDASTDLDYTNTHLANIIILSKFKNTKNNNVSEDIYNKLLVSTEQKP